MSRASTSKTELRDPSERFVELANKRVTNAIKSIRLVGNLANKRAYHYTDADSRKIIKAIHEELEILKTRFRGDRSDAEKIFSL